MFIKNSVHHGGDPFRLFHDDDYDDDDDDHGDCVECLLCRNYLELMVDLPWSKMTDDKLDISQARYVNTSENCLVDYFFVLLI